jgi:hypothetical protein
MKTLQQPDGRKLLLPVLPIDAHNIRFEAKGYLYWNTEADEYGFDFMRIGEPNYNYTILGTIHYENGKPVFGFDPTPFVEQVFTEYTPGFPESIGFKDYNDADHYFDNPQQSFISRLNAEADTWFVNPEMHPADLHTTDRRHYQIVESRWRAAEEKVVRGKLIVILRG